MECHAKKAVRKGYLVCVCVRERRVRSVCTNINVTEIHKEALRYIKGH